MTHFKQFWEQMFPTCPPAGFLLRTELEDRWVRFHSLPQSKRYAENESEMEIVLSRANALASEVLGVGGHCWLVASYPHPGDLAYPDNPAAVEFDLKPTFEWRDPYSDDEAPPWQAHAKERRWEPGDFDDLLRMIADDVEPAVIWVSQKTNIVFAPYDGGIDIILPRTSGIEDLKRKYPDWLPSHPKGL